MRPALLLLFASILHGASPTTDFVAYNSQYDPETQFRTLNGRVEATARGLRANGVELIFGGGSWRPQQSSGNSFNFFIGNQPGLWRSDVTGFRTLRKDAIAPGVDIVVYGSQEGSFEYDILLKSPAHCRRVQIEVRGAIPVALRDGSIRLGPVIQRPPQAFQVVDGKEVPVGSRFLVYGTSLHVEVETSHPGPVRIDPVIDYSSKFSGAGDEQVIAVQGDTVFGTTTSLTPAGQPANRPVNKDLFWRKRTATGISTTYWGGSGDDHLTAVNGSFAVGFTDSRDLPLRAGFLGDTPRSFAGGESDGFILNLIPLQPEATYWGGFGADRIWAVATMGGNLIAAGDTDSPEFGVARGRDRDAVLIPWSEPAPLVVGGAAFDSFRAISVQEGRVLAAGSTKSADLRLLNAWQTELDGDEDGLLAEWTTRKAGGFLPARLTYSGGPAADRFTAICQNPAAIFLAGESNGDVWLTTTKLDLSMPRSHTYPASGDETVAGCQISNWDIVLAGTTTSRDFPVQAALQPQYGGGDSDGFVLSVEPSGRLIWSSYAGGKGRDVVATVSQGAPDPNPLAGIVLAGSTDSDDFPSAEASDGSELGPGGGRGGMEAFALRLRRATISAPDVVVGHNLQAAVPIAGATEPDANGIVTIESLTPEKVLVSPSIHEAGSAKLTIFDADLGNSRAFFVQALTGEGEAVLSIRGKHYPERFVRVRLVRSQLTTTGTLYRDQSPPTAELFNVHAKTVALDPDGPPLPQLLRPGLLARIRWESSNPAVATHSLLPATQDSLGSSYTGVYSIRGAGSARLRAVLDGLETGDSFFVVELASTRIHTPSVLIARHLRAGVSIPALNMTLRVTSTDPSRVLLSNTQQGAPSASIDVTNLYRAFYVDALASEGDVDLIVEGGPYRERLLVRIAPLRAVFAEELTRPPRIVAGDSFSLPIEFGPTTAARRNANGFLVPNQFPGPGSPLTPVQRSSLHLPPSMTATHWFYSQNDTLSYAILARQAGVWRIDLNVPEATELGEPVRVEIVSPKLPPSRPLLVARAMQTPLDLSGLTVPAAELRQFTISTRNPAVARLSSGRSLQTADSLTLDLTSPNYDRPTPVVIGIGAPGSSTFLDLRTTSGLSYSVPVTVGALSADPMVDEPITPLAEPLITFRFVAIHPTTNERSLNQTPVTLGALSTPVTPVVTSGPCTAGRIEFFGPPYGSINLPLTCRQPGTAEVALNFGSAPNIVTSRPARVRITAQAPAPTASGQRPFPERLLVAKGLQRRLSYYLANSPEVTLISSDPSKVRVAADPKAPGRERVVIRGGTGYIQGVASEGTATVWAQLANTDPVPISIHLLPATFVVSYPRSTMGQNQLLTRDVQVPFVPGENSYLTLEPAAYDSDTGTLIRAEFTIAGGTDPFPLRWTLTNPGVIDLLSPPPIVEEGQDKIYLSFRQQTPGTIQFALLQPPGFEETPDSRLRLQFTQQQLRSTSAIILGRDLQASISLALTESPYPSRLTGMVTATSSDPSRLLLSLDPRQPGAETITFEASRSFFAQSLAGNGDVHIQLRGSSFMDTSIPVELVDSELSLSATPLPEIALAVGGSVNFSLAPVPVKNGVRFSNLGGSISVRPGYFIPVEAIVSDPGILRFASLQAALSGGDERFYFTVSALSIGRAQLRLRVPEGLSSRLDPVSFQVLGGTVRFEPPPVGRGTQQSAQIYSESASGLLRLESLDPSRLLLSLDGRQAGSSAVELNVTGGGYSSVWLQALGAPGTVPVRLSGTAFAARTAEARIEAPGLTAVTFDRLRIGLVGTSETQLTLTNGMVSPASGPLTVNLRSSDTRVFTVPATVSIPVRETRRSVPITPVSAGSATFSWEAHGTTSSLPIDVARGQFTANRQFTSPARFSNTESVSLSLAPPAGGFVVRITSLTPGIATVGQGDALTTTEIQVPVPPGQNTVSFRLDGIRPGTASIRLAAPGYDDLIVPATVVPVGYRFELPTLTLPVGADRTLRLAAVILDPQTRAVVAPLLSASPQPGLSAPRITITNSDPASVQASQPVSIVADPVLLVRGLAPGRARLTITQPDGFLAPAQGSEIEIVVP